MTTTHAKLINIVMILSLFVEAAGLAAAQERQFDALDQNGDPLPDGAVARLGTVRFRHEGEAKALAFTPDAKTLAGYTTSSGVIIWDATTGKERHRLPVRLSTEAFGMAISPDGATIAVVDAPPWDNEHKIVFWDVALIVLHNLAAG